MSLLDNIQPASELNPTKDLKIRGLLVGASGTGKRTGATTIPGRKLLVDLDNRGESVAGFKDVSIIKILEKNPAQPRAWLDLENLKEEIWQKVRKGEFPFDGIIVASISSMCKFSMNWSLLLTGSEGKQMGRGPGGGPAQPHYAPAMYRLDRFINSMLALPLHIIFTAHVELFEDAHLKTLTYYPKIIGKLRTEIGNWFNETYLTTSIRGAGGKTKYLWQTKGGGDRTPFIKSALNQLGNYWEDPVELDFEKEPRGFKLLIEKRFGKKEE